MRSAVLAAFTAVLTCASLSSAQEPKTFFDHIETAYVVAEVQLASALKFRDGKLLVYPAKVSDVLRARVGKPQTLMLVHELRGEETAPPFPTDAPFLAPIVLLPQYSYWRDNLPKTPHHQIVGGTRYIFRGDDIEEAKRVAKPFAASLALERVERWPDQAAAIVDALASSLPVLQQDAARYLAGHEVLLTNMRPETRDRLAAFLEVESANGEREFVLGAIAKAKLENLAPVLEKLTLRDDSIAVAALLALDAMGKPRDLPALEALSLAKTDVVRAYAFETMGARAANDPSAFTRATAALIGEGAATVRAAAARGLGKSGDVRAIEPLGAALARGDGASRDSAMAIAAIGGPAAADVLKKAITGGDPEAMTAAVTAMVQLRNECADCLAFLRDQHSRHPDEGIRDLIAMMLELEKKHEH